MRDPWNLPLPGPKSKPPYGYDKPAAPEVRERLEAKLKGVRGEMELLQTAGAPPYDVVELMQSFQPAGEAADYAKAEAILDEATKSLGLEE